MPETLTERIFTAAFMILAMAGLVALFYCGVLKEAERQHMLRHSVVQR